MCTRSTLMCMLVFTCVLVVHGCERRHDHGSSETPKVNATLQLTGTGLGKPASYTFEQLASMKMTRLDNVLMRKTHEDDETTSWQGPALEPLRGREGW